MISAPAVAAGLILVAAALASSRAAASVGAGGGVMVDAIERLSGVDRNVEAFLRMVRVAEGTAGLSGYSMLYGGGQFSGFAVHPNIAVTAGGITSTAAGAYQILFGTWREAAAALLLPDFSPGSQDRAAVWLIRRRGALDDVVAGRLDAAIAKCAPEWASLPGAPYGQPTIAMDRARAAFVDAGGVIA